MDENLIGYLLDALDPETQREVEAYLREHPDGRDRLEHLRRALEPLEADREPAEPRPGLVVRTIGLVAEYQCRRFEIPNRFAIGYGLDHGERYRNLPYVAALKQ